MNCTKVEPEDAIIKGYSLVLDFIFDSGANKRNGLN